ncbi:uncharacterized protein FIBRA_08384 [Fibroporia radiculosa]|uniref:Uncharacterized protein n=1 Tax=Fibroporia radiculosa TaxID=599839 RepID=J4H552_9APHY|nr:uncharacterized protein FIBRA_08384 [Fibroporia radiculosa]CCM06134.1 predicted protein [Fibroporia radiculosa]
MPANSNSPTQVRRLQARKPGSSVLWGHLLSDSAASSIARSADRSSPNLPPIAPTDKAGTSLRILLHDTQANLEKFSDRVSKLTGGVDESRREIVTVQTLFQQDRENLVETMVNLVNRCQVEVQRSLGSPAQDSRVEGLRKDIISVERKLETLDKKMDTLHTLNQTQSQTLQALQDQQVKLLENVVAMLPLLQTMPLHIENARNAVKDTIRESEIFSRPIVALQNALTRKQEHIVADQCTTHPIGVEAVSANLSPGPHGSRKKRKLHAEDRGLDCVSIQEHIGSVAARPSDLAQVYSKTSLLLTTPRPAKSRVSPVNLCGKTPTSAVTLQSPARIPLTDILPPNKSTGTDSLPHSSRLLRTPVSHAAADHRFKTPLRPASRPPGAVSTTLSRAPVRPALGNSAPATEMPQKVSSLASSSSTLSQRSSAQERFSSGLSGPTVDSRMAIVAQTCSRNSLHSSITSATASPSIPIPAAPRCNPSDLMSRVMSGIYSPTGIHDYRFHTPIRSSPMIDDLSTTSFPKTYTPHMNKVNDGPLPTSSKPMSIRDRRAQLATPIARTESKRFIPLDDDEDGDLSLE